MAEVAASSAAATKCTEILIGKAMKELPYFCCSKSYAVDFGQKKDELSAALKSVRMKIEEAKKRNEAQIDPIVDHWVQKANKLIQQDTRPKKWLGFCTDWFSQYSLAKELERMTQEIPTMMERAGNFSQVAHEAERPGMGFYSQEFMNFKSRNLIFEQLREELKDKNKYRIGLQAMGGSGKTTMAKEIGKELENSKAFDKVIFIEVPNPVDEKKIRDEITKKLDLKIEDDKKKNLTEAEQIWIRIANAGSVLVILDDVWEKLNLENIGIHHGIHTQGRCCVLLTTRHETVCKSMRCQKTINLGVLPEEDAVNLFLYHASESGKDCPNKLKLLALKIVNECGNLPVIVVAVARTFRNWDPEEWEDAFAAIEKDSSIRHVNTDEEAKKFYNSLQISFRCQDTQAQDLILLCSIFPRAYEIPVELLSRIAIGLGLCENVNSYYRARSQVLLIKTKLISFALLLTAREGCVKMHDVIRDVAQQIGGEKIQVIMDCKTKLKENVKYSSWMIDDFSHYFEGNNLEVLLVWVKANGSLEVSDSIFGGMKRLKVLLLCSMSEFGRTLALSLPKSIHSLENIQTLSLTNWELGDISIVQNLKKLHTLELTNCLITELPNDVSQLEKLRLLHLERCLIKRNNPFEVIGRCSKLEVLYYVSNSDALTNANAKHSKITVLQKFGIYHIEGGFSERYFQLDASTKRYFNSTRLKGILSESSVKSLAARAEILELTECNEARWTNLIPDMVHPTKDGDMKDLIRLSLISWPTIQCLICTNGIQSHSTIFSNLVELRLHDMHVRELCHGDLPNDFLKQLEKLDLSRCVQLDGTLFEGKLELSNLKSVELEDCSMTCLFHLSTAQSLKQLEKLYIRGCSKLKCLISDDDRSSEHKVDDHQDPNQKNHHSMLPKLKFLKVQECHELEFILSSFPCKELESMKVSDCNELKYIFGQCLEEGGLYQMEKEIILPLLQKIKIAKIPKFINIYPECYVSQPSQVQKSWGPLCCLSSKASALSIDEPSFSKANQLDHTQASKEKYRSRAGGIFTLPLCSYKNLRKMSIEGFSELKSILTLSIASSLELLEELIIKECGELEHIVTDEGHVYNHMSDSFSFSNLKQVTILNAEKLKYMFGKCHSNKKHNVRIELNLPDLTRLCFHNVPNMVGICSENYSMKALSLQDISLENCPLLHMHTVMHLAVDVQKREEDVSKRKEKGKKEFLCLYITKASKGKFVPSAARGYSPPPLYQFNLREIEISGFSELTSLFTISIASSLKLLETLTVNECDRLEYIITDEGSNSHSHMNVHSIFPNLQIVYVWKCNNLEYVFPAFYSKDFKVLEYVNIEKAKKMKYVFGKCHADQNDNVHQSELNLPALKLLDLDEVPNMVRICAENYFVRALYLEHIIFAECPQLPQPFITFLVGGCKRQEDLSRRKALSFKEKGKALSNLQQLSNLRDIYVGPKNFLSFRNLLNLTFRGCKQLKFILSASNTRSIPELRSIFISDCEELVSFIEDDEENQHNPLDLHQSCFPKLRIIQVKCCKKLKCLFFISTCPKLLRLLMLEIEDAPELAQVFEGKQSPPQELLIKDVLPDLIGLRLVKLPSLHTIYQGIDFQTVKIRIVHDCNNIPSANVSSSELFDFRASLQPYPLNFEDDVYLTRFMINGWAFKRQRDEESEEALERDRTISEQNSSTPNQDDSKEAPKEAVEKDSTLQKQISSSNLTEIEEEGSQEDIGNDLTLPKQSNVSPNFENNTETSANEIAEEQLSTSNTAATPSSKSHKDNLIHKASSSTHSELTILNLGTSASTKDLCEKESKGDQEALGEGISLNEGPRGVEEPTNDLFTIETTKKVSLAIPPITTTEKTSPLESMGDQQAFGECGSSNDEASQRVEEPTNEFSSKETLNEVSLKIPPPSVIEMTSALSEEASKETVEKDSTIQKQKSSSPNFTENTETSTNEIVEEQLSNSNIGATPSSESHKESKGDQGIFGEGISLNKGPQRVKEPTNDLFTQETTEKVALAIPPLDPSITTPEKSQIATSTTQSEPKSSQLDLFDISITSECPQSLKATFGESPSLEKYDKTSSSTYSKTKIEKPHTSTASKGQIMVNEREISIEDDLIRLFQIMRDGSELEVGQSCISKIATFEDDKVAKAFADIESSLKMDLHQIANSEEHTHRLENALNFLSTHFSEDGPSSLGLVRGKIDSLHQETQKILSSFKLASDNLDTFTKLKGKEQWIDEQHSQRMEEAITLVSEIRNTEDYIIGVKDQISRLQAELKRKEKDLEDYEIKLSSLQNKREEFVLDTIGFMEEYEAVKKDRSYVVDGQTKARQELKKLEDQWPSCVADLRKNALLLGILLKQKF